jgi:hypothetical protein
MDKKTRGRPASENPLGRAKAVRFTLEEEALVEEAARADNVKTARWIRERAVEAARARVNGS